MDKIKDEYIKKTLQQDKVMSSKANNVFEKFKLENEQTLNNNQNNETLFKYKKINKYLAYVASFLFLIFIGTGIVVYNQSNNNVKIDTTVIQNDKRLVENEQIIKQSQNDYYIVSLLKDNIVTIQLKQKAIDKYNVNSTPDTYYEVKNVISKVSDVFVGTIGSEDNQYVILLQENGTIQYIDILANYSENNKFEFKNQGTIYGYSDIVSVEQEQKSKSNEIIYYINAVNNKGTRQEIIIDKNEELQTEQVNANSNNTTEENKKSFTSQDGTAVYTIDAKEGDYIQAFGWAGASNNVYYIKDNCLYHMSLVDGSTTKLITGVNKISYNTDLEKINVDVTDGYIIHKQDVYLNISALVNISENEEEISYTIKNEYGSADQTKEIKGKDFTTLPGGSTRTCVYYISGQDLYEVKLLDDFPTRKIAEGIEGLSNENNEKIIATKGENAKILVSINYIEYK